MLDWNARSRTFETIAGFTPSVGSMVMSGRDGNAETVSRQWVTVGHFRCARRPADCRPHVLRGRRAATRRVRRDQRRFMGNPIQSRSRHRRQRAQARRRVVDRRRRGAEGASRSSAGRHVGDAAVRQHAAARARRVSAAGGRPHEAGRGDQGGAVRSRRRRRGAVARVSGIQQGPQRTRSSRCTTR